MPASERPSPSTSTSDKFIRHVAVEVFVADNDGVLGDYGMNNFYFYGFENKTLFTFIAWDKSEAFKGGAEYGIFHNITDVPSWLQNRLMARAISYPDLYELYLDTLLECARSASEPAPGSTGGPGWLEREIQREYEQIRDAALADPVKPFSNDDFVARGRRSGRLRQTAQRFRHAGGGSGAGLAAETLHASGRRVAAAPVVLGPDCRRGNRGRSACGVITGCRREPLHESLDSKLNREEPRIQPAASPVAGRGCPVRR